MAWGRGARVVGFEEGIVRKLSHIIHDILYYFNQEEAGLIINSADRLPQSPSEHFQCCFRGRRGESQKAIRADSGGSEEGEE